MRKAFIARFAVLGLLAISHPLAFGQEEEGIDRTPQECISTNRISHARVIDERSVLFYMLSRSVYLNTLQDTCRGLRKDDRIVYSTRTGRLCDVDAVTAPNLGRSAVCTLGVFRPITREEARLLERDPEALDGVGRSIDVEQVEPPPEEAADE